MIGFRKRLAAVASALALVVGMLAVGGSPPVGASAPLNDDFSSPAALPSTTSGNETGSSLDATMEAGEPEPWGDARATLWWTWTAPSTGTYLFNTCGSEFTTELGIYSGSTLGSLTDVRTVDRFCWYEGDWRWNGGWEFPALEGETYRIQLGGAYGGAMGNYVLRWWPQVAPENDDFANATLLAGISGTALGTNRFSTVEALEPLGAASVWWEWTPPVAGTYMFDTCASNVDTLLGIYTGTSLDDLTEVALNDDGCSLQSLTAFLASSDTTYYIAVAGYTEHEMGDIVLHWQSDIPPDNDNFVNALPLPSTTSGTATGNTRYATTEPGEINELDGRSIWWTWTAPATGTYMFDTCRSNNYNSLGVYTGGSVDTLTEVVDVEYAAHCFRGAQLLFDATAGTAYVIGVGDGDYNDDVVADIVLNWATGTAPDNDVFASAFELAGVGGTLETSNRFATAEIAEPTHGLSRAEHSIWWKWTAPATPTEVTFDTCGSSMPEAAIGVYTGTAVNALTQVGTRTWPCDHSAVTFTPSPGGVYYIALDGNFSGMGDIIMHWPASGTPAAPAISNNPSNTTVETGATAQFTAQAVGVPAPTVLWQVSTDGGNSWDDISGMTSPTLNVAAVYTMNGNQYRAVFTNPSDSVTSAAATLTVTYSEANATVSGATAKASKGKVTVSFTPSSTLGAPTATHFQCSFGGKGAKGGWTACTPGYVYKGSATTAYIRSGYSPTGPWGTTVTVLVTRA